MKDNKQNNENKSIKKFYSQPKLEEMGNISGLTKGGTGEKVDSNNSSAGFGNSPSLP